MTNPKKSWMYKMTDFISIRAKFLSPGMQKLGNKKCELHQLIFKDEYSWEESLHKYKIHDIKIKWSNYTNNYKTKTICSLKGNPTKEKMS